MWPGKYVEETSLMLALNGLKGWIQFHLLLNSIKVSGSSRV